MERNYSEAKLTLKLNSQRKQENRKLGPDGRVLYVPRGSLSRSPFSGGPA